MPQRNDKNLLDTGLETSPFWVTALYHIQNLLGVEISQHMLKYPPLPLIHKCKLYNITSKDVGNFNVFIKEEDTMYVSCNVLNARLN
jgi:hypothetical protein